MTGLFRAHGVQVIQGGAPPPCKKLAYDVVRLATLSDADWDLVLEGLKAVLPQCQPSRGTSLFVVDITIIVVVIPVLSVLQRSIPACCGFLFPLVVILVLSALQI